MSEWTDLEAMLNDIARHTSETGDTVINADSPPNVRFIAYKPLYESPGPGDFSAEWSISLGRISGGLAAIEARDPMKGRLLRSCFTTGEGRCGHPKCKPLKVRPKKNPTRFNRPSPL